MPVEIKRIQEFKNDEIFNLFSRVGERTIDPNPRFFEDESNILLVAYAGAEPCGFLYGYLLESLRSKQPKVFLYSIDVVEEYRAKGVGTQLIETLKNIAKQRACQEIFVLTNRANLAAMKLYEKTGGAIESSDDVMFVYLL
jgi:ribosomal protein S18 acetylase RimI-like enzyme